MTPSTAISTASKASDGMVCSTLAVPSAMARARGCAMSPMPSGTAISVARPTDTTTKSRCWPSSAPRSGAHRRCQKREANPPCLGAVPAAAAAAADAAPPGVSAAPGALAPEAVASKGRVPVAAALTGSVSPAPAVAPAVGPTRKRTKPCATWAKGRDSSTAWPFMAIMSAWSMLPSSCCSACHAAGRRWGRSRRYSSTAS